jgi:phosphopantothenoylcysteine decarboxylase / phosphopantothenate---cysteine ligase
MTAAAEQFITAGDPAGALSGRPVFTSQWDAQWDGRTAAGVDNNMPHINLSREADAILVAPASADFMAKLLHGRADDLLSLMCLARPIDKVPLILAPAMNREMWAHPATQRNVMQLRADGTTVLDVGVGEQACGETGDGRMLEPEELLYEVVRFFTPKVLAGPAGGGQRRTRPSRRSTRCGALPTCPAARWVLPSPGPRTKPAPT